MHTNLKQTPKAECLQDSKRELNPLYLARSKFHQGFSGILMFLLSWTMSSAQQSINSLTLINSDTNEPIAQYDPLIDGTTIVLSDLPSINVNIAANTSPSPVGSVRFSFNGISNFKTETAPPYAIAGDDNGNFNAWSLTTGNHTITATPYTEGSAKGLAGTPLTINFVVTDSNTISENDGGTSGPIGSQQALAFHGAEGWAAQTPGGRGGKIIKVKNLNQEGPGSLKAAIDTTGPKIIIFDVGGVIDLNGTFLKLDNPFTTIAGESAPTPGITIVNGGFQIQNTHDIVIRHLRIRPGAAQQPMGWEPDAISIYASHNVIIDHCSLSWSVDEQLSANGPWFTGDSYSTSRDGTSHDITLSNNIVSEALGAATHDKGFHSKASLLGDNTTNLLLTKNLYAHNYDRNPVTRAGSQAAIINNIIYNCNLAAHYQSAEDRWVSRISEWGAPPLALVSMAGNILQRGVRSNSVPLFRIADDHQNIPSVSGKPTLHLFLDDNLQYFNNGVLDTISDEVKSNTPSLPADSYLVDTPPIWPPDLTLLASSDVKNHVVNNAGARPWESNQIDDRIVSEYLNITGSIPNLETQREGLPIASGTFRQTDFDTDEDGMPNIWEISKNLDPNKQNHNGLDLDYNKHYTNIEVYLMEITGITIESMPTPTIPISPNGLDSVVNKSSEIQLSWADNSNNESGFRLERKIDAGEFSIIAEVGTGTTTYTDSNIDEFSTHTYRVYAFNTAGVSSQSNLTVETTQIHPPTNLTTIASSNSQINLKWADNSDVETGYIIERKEEAAPYEQISLVEKNTTSFEDFSPNLGIAYTYRVRAVSINEVSNPSNESTIRIDSEPITTLEAPTNLVATAISHDEIFLTWTDNSNNEHTFIVQRRQALDPWIEVAQLPPSRETFSDINLSKSTTYSYRIIAQAGLYRSTPSNESSETTFYLSNTSSTPNISIEDTTLETNVNPTTTQGSSSYNSETNLFNVTDNGGYIGGKNDDFNYVYQEIEGDVEVRVRVESPTTFPNKANAGIMLRESQAPGSIHAYVCLTNSHVEFVRRLDEGQGTKRSSIHFKKDHPTWLQISRKDQKISVYYSNDGFNWKLLSEDTINFSPYILAGLAVSAGSEGQAISADFDDLRLEETDTLLTNKVFINLDIGAVGLNGDSKYNPQTGSFLLEAAGKDIGDTADSFHYTFQQTEGDFEVSTRIDSLISETEWAKAGLMSRVGITPDAPYYAIFYANGIGVVHQSRNQTGTGTDWSSTQGTQLPFWVKIRRQGEQFQSLYSENNVEWTTLNTTTLPAPSRIMIGLALTSHTQDALSYAEFSEITIEKY